ncbi:MAG: methyltransferase [Oscillospiraceae bacterium]
MTEQSFEKLTENIEVCVSKEHRFGTDAFLLADFANPRMKDFVCDLGTGCGIIPFVMSRKFPPKKILAVDIQPQAIEQLKLGIERSNLANIVPICADLKALWKDAPLGELDVVTCNPPYKAADCGIKSEIPAQKIARHEIFCDINDVCKAAAKLLKFGGKFCLCNRPERLCDVVSAMKANDLEPKTLRFVSKTPNDAPWLFLIEGKKGGKPFLNVMRGLFVKSDCGEFSEEMLRIYGKI